MKKKSKGILDHIFYDSEEGKTVLMGSIFLSVLGMLCNIVPYLSVYFIGKIFLTDGGGKEKIFAWISVAGAAVLFQLVFSFFGSLGCHKVAFEILCRYRLRLMEHLGKLPLGFFARNTGGSLQKIMDENIEKLEGVIAHMLPNLIGSAAVLFSLLFGITYLSRILALTVVVSVVVAFFFQFMVFGGEKSKARYGQYMQLSADITGTFSEYVKGMAEVKLFGRIGGMTKNLEKNLDDCLGWELENYRRSAFFMSMYKTMILSILTFIVPVGGFLIYKNPVGDTVLSVIMAMILVPALYEPFLTFVDYSMQINFVKAGLMQIDAILQEPTFQVKPNSEQRTGSTVCFNSVSFSYENLADPIRKMALKEVSFTCREREMTALVGESGSGKSTVGQLLMRFWDVEEGKISIGGKDIKSMAPEELMEEIAFVFQDTYIFSDTVRNNISMNRECSEEDIVAAAKKARCHEFIMALPKGYDTVIGSGNIKLSGGEAQRISIARTFLKNSNIVILDEALAYTDAENENLIQDAIRELVADKTVIVIAHRLKSIMDADRILVLKEGVILEEGTHEELIEKAGEYKTLWDLQFEAEAWAIEGKGGDQS